MGNSQFVALLALSVVAVVIPKFWVDSAKNSEQFRSRTQTSTMLVNGVGASWMLIIVMWMVSR